MDFNSPLFLLFLLLVVLLNYFLPQKFRTSLLIFSSFIFIGYFNILSLAFVLCFILFNFYSAFYTSKFPIIYYLSLLLNGLSIVVYNYLAAISFFNLSSLHNGIIILGVLFYSLQNISYQTEVFFKRIQPEKSILNYTLYIAFFPKFTSGPIMLPNEFIPQIEKPKTNQFFIEGFNRFLIGLVKKMVIADRLAPSVHSIFDFSDQYSGLTTLIGVYLYTIQLYFNFSGYTDMAIGISKMLGYDLKENFKFPFRATSITDFWRRWHISLMNFFSNYIYYPVAYYMRKHKKLAISIAITLTFLLSGIWHGLGIMFIVWAMCHILFMVYELYTKNFRLKLSQKINPLVYRIISIFIVFNLVCLSDVFLRAHSINHALLLLQNIFTDFIPISFLTDFIGPLAVGGHQEERFNFYIVLVFASVYLLFEKRIVNIVIKEKLNIGIIIFSVLLILLFGALSSTERFIYMQF